MLLVNTFLCYICDYFYLEVLFLLLTERIKDLASKQNMTFASLERDAGLGRGTIRKWDTNSPSADQLFKVANLLNTSMDFLLSGKENKTTGILSIEDSEWLSLLHQLPPEKMLEFKGELKGYIRRLDEEANGDEPLRKAK